MWRKLLLLSSLLVACVGDDPLTVNNSVAPFIGKWTTTMAKQTVRGCLLAQQNPDRTDIEITYSVAASTDGTSDLTLSNDIAAGCTLKAKVVDGTYAQLTEGNTCTANPTDRVEFTYTYIGTSIFKLSDDKKTATFDLNASFTDKRNGVESGYTCAFTESSPLTKQ